MIQSWVDLVIRDAVSIFRNDSRHASMTPELRSASKPDACLAKPEGMPR